MPTVHRFSSNVLWYGLGQLGAVAFGLLYSVVTARLLGVEGKGELALFVALVTVGAAALDPGLRPAAVFRAAQGQEPEELLRTSLTAALVTGLVVAALVTVSHRGEYWIAAGIAAYLARDAVRFVLHGRQRMAAVAGLGLWFSVISLVVIVLLVSALGLGTDGAKASFILALLFCTGWGLYSLDVSPSDLVGERLSFDSVRELLKFGSKAYPALILTVLSGRFELFVVTTMLGSRGAGLFSIVLLGTEVIGHIPMTFGAVLFPRVASDRGSGTFYTEKCLRHTIPIVALASIATWFLAEPFIVKLYSEQFRPAAPALVIASLGWVFFGVRSILSDYFYGTGRPQWQSLSATVYMGSTFLLSLYFIPRFGLLGAGAAQAIGNSVAGLSMLYVYARERNQSAVSILRLRREDVHDYGKLVSLVTGKQR